MGSGNSPYIRKEDMLSTHAPFLPSFIVSHLDAYLTPKVHNFRSALQTRQMSNPLGTTSYIVPPGPGDGIGPSTGGDAAEVEVSPEGTALPVEREEEKIAYALGLAHNVVAQSSVPYFHPGTVRPLLSSEAQPTSRQPSATITTTAVGHGDAGEETPYVQLAESQDRERANIVHYFQGAQNVIFENAIMIDIHTGKPGLDSRRAAIALLERRRIPGGEIDSSARYPPPSCHPETRKALRGRTTTWLANPTRDCRMVWVLGPAGVGKSAIAQTIAEHARDTGRLGAAFFFSRPNGRRDPLRVIPTLAHQLAVQFPEYNIEITHQLANDSTILEKNLRFQFKKLIIEPFNRLMARRLFDIKQPILIILDGLDECKGEDAQSEFIELINEHIHLVDTLPILWIICSRPEWHFKTLLAQVDFPVRCRREELSIDDDEARRDVERFLRSGFQKIRQDFWGIPNVGDKPWPTESQLGQLVAASSGLFIFASTVLKYIGDKDFGNPRARLKESLEFVNGSEIGKAAGPLDALDLLYKQILSTVPPSILPISQRILGFIVLFPEKFSVRDIANFLCLSQGTFYIALRQLHSVLDIPLPAQAHCQGVRFYHASFSDFLKDSSRSGEFVLDVEKAYSDTIARNIQWCTRLLEHPRVFQENSQWSKAI